MLMPDIDTVRGWQGRTMGDGDRIGSIEGIYADDQSGEPEWALVKTGLFGTKSTFVPIAQASQRNDDVRVPHDKQLVKDAPRVEADQHLSEAEEQQLWRHYGLDYGAVEAGGTAQPQSGTEEVTQTVPVRREEVRLEREPVTDANLDAATSGPELTESEHEVVLHEERPVVDKEVVPRERVRLDTETVTEERQVGEEVRKEQIEVDEGDTDVRDDRRP
jgi:uncharacterized protein (TIGR02271 family)